MMKLLQCFGKKNWLVKVLPIAYCAIGVLLMTAVPVYADDIFATAKKRDADGLYGCSWNCNLWRRWFVRQYAFFLNEF